MATNRVGIDGEILSQLIVGSGSASPYNQNLTGEEEQVFRYFLRHGWAAETGDLDRLTMHLSASPELGHLRGENRILHALRALCQKKMLEHIEVGSNAVWMIGPSDELAKRCRGEFQEKACQSLMTLLASHLADFTASMSLVVHDGAARSGGAEDIEAGISSVPRGGHVRWMTYNTLSDEFLQAIERRAVDTDFNLRILMVAKNAHPDLMEGAPKESFRRTLNDRDAILRGLKERLKGINPKVQVVLRQYRDPREGCVRGILVSDTQDNILRLSLIAIPSPPGDGPSGRGTEGVRLICTVRDNKVASVAHWFKWHFDTIWRKRGPVGIWVIPGLTSVAVVALVALLGLLLFDSTRPSALVGLFGLMGAVAVALIISQVTRR